MGNLRTTRHGRPPPGEVRIIGGEWRGRRVPVVDSPGVRPTADRIRETLFNWLAPLVPGARCLDLFAGTGALGLEALSRGAAAACFVERDAVVARSIEETLRRFGCDKAEIVTGDAQRYLAGTPRAFDIVFLDPPFQDTGSEVGLGDLCKLIDRGWLAGAGRVYLEMPERHRLPPLPDAWSVLREKAAGQVRYALASGPARADRQQEE